jgi:hypothetical protein
MIEDEVRMGPEIRMVFMRAAAAGLLNKWEDDMLVRLPASRGILSFGIRINPSYCNY